MMEGSTGKINILFVMMQMEMGGSERLVNNLALKIDRDLFNPSVAWFFGDRILKEFNDLNITLYHVPKIGRIDLSAMRKLGDIIKDNNIHILNAHHFMFMVYAFYGCKIMSKRKLIYTEHSEWEIEKIPWKWRIAGKYLLRNVDGVIGVSGGVSKKIIEILKTDPSKTFTIENGVDIESFERKNEKEELKKIRDRKG